MKSHRSNRLWWIGPLTKPERSLGTTSSLRLGCIVLAGIMFMFHIAASAAAPIETFTPSQVALLHWGSGTQDVGLSEAAGPGYGPQSLAIDSDGETVTLLDSVNQRIISIGGDAEVREELQIELGSADFCEEADGSRNVLYSTNRWVHYTARGAKLHDAFIPAGPGPISAIGCGKDGVHFNIGTLGSISRWKFTPAGQSEWTEQKVQLLSSGSFVAHRQPPSGARVQLFDSRGLQSTAFLISKTSSTIETVSMIGQDSRQNLYLVTDERLITRSRDSGGVRRILNVYSTEGVLLAEAELPYNPAIETFVDLRVSPAGAVFQILPLAEGLQVIRWDWSAPQTTWPKDIELEERLSQLERDRTADASADIDSVPRQIAASITRMEILKRAAGYANQSYTTTSSNHTSSSGVVCGGKTVITPSTTKSTFKGLPYKWGGFSGITGLTTSTDNSVYFTEGISGGKYAGDKNCTGTQSSCAVGVDCAGFVAQTWGLTSTPGSSGLTAYGSKLTNRSDMYSGDLLYTSGHVMLFAGLQDDGKYAVYEASANDWKVAWRTYSDSSLSGYTAYRYTSATDAVPYFNPAPTLASTVTLPNKIYFTGTAKDTEGLAKITMKVTGPKGSDLTAFSVTVSGTSKSLSSYYFDSNNATYAGVKGSYTVALWIKDNVGQTASKTFSVTVK